MKVLMVMDVVVFVFFWQPAISTFVKQLPIVRARAASCLHTKKKKKKKKKKIPPFI